MIRTVKLEQLRKIEQKFINESISNDITENAYECDKYKNTIIESNHEVSFEYKSTTIYDQDGDPLDSESEIAINYIEEYDLEELLKSKNIKFEKSSSSESIYLNNGNTRISTHKRPGYEGSGGCYETHEYEEDIILENQIEMYKYIERNY